MRNMTLGVDLGQAVDPTAIVALGTYRPEPTHAEDWPPLRHRIVWIERVPLGTHYERVVDRIVAVGEEAKTYASTTIVLDGTGVGRPIVDMLRSRTSLPLRAVTFTSGEREVQPEFDVFRVPKVDLVRSLEVVLQARRLEYAPDCPNREELLAELANFDFGFTARGNATFEASAGSHDDLVFALCLAIWWAERPAGPGQAWIEATQRQLARRAGGVR